MYFAYSLCDLYGLAVFLCEIHYFKYTEVHRTPKVHCFAFLDSSNGRSPCPHEDSHSTMWLNDS